MLNSQIRKIITNALHENFAEFTEDKVDAIISALTNAGFVLVPSDATRKMISAGEDACDQNGYTDPEYVWNAMIEAAQENNHGL